MTATKNGTRQKIVVVGGGSGSSNILRGLKKHDVDLTAIVTMFDSGGSTGLLRSELGYPSLGDLRQCLVALGDDRHDTKRFGEALQFRFGSKTSVNGHNVGNLLLAALTSLSGDLEKAIDDIGSLLHVSGRVIPVALDQAELCAELEDGKFIQGESNIDLRGTVLPRIVRVFLSEEVDANPNAIQAISEADAIVFGPGDLYTSIIPNLLPTGMTEAIASSKATKLFLCNLMTKRGETDDFKASDFLKVMTNYLGRDCLDWFIVNSERPDEYIEKSYISERAFFVEPDLDAVKRLVKGVRVLPLATCETSLRHDPEKTAKAVLDAIDVRNLFKDHQRNGKTRPGTTNAVPSID